jgi:hypothetical protein
MAAGTSGSVWAGRIASAIPVLLLALSGTFKLVGAFTHDPRLVEGWVQFGYPLATMLPIGLVEVGCAIVYAVPRTAALGAILVTGYLGGAIATHVRAGQAVWIAPLTLGVLAWLGLFLRDARVRALLPVRSGSRT